MTGHQAADRIDGPDTPTGRALRAAVMDVVDGSTVAEAATRYGVPPPDLALAIEHWLQGSARANRKPGARAWSPTRRKLTVEQEEEIVRAVRDGLPSSAIGALWSRESVHALVLERTGLALAERTLSTYLERWGFSPGKPLRRLHKLHPTMMRAWMVRDYPVVAMQAREEEGILYWCSSVPLVAGEARSTEADRRPWRITYVVTNRGHARWQVHEGDLDVARLIAFLEHLSAPASPKLFLLVEDLPLFVAPAFIEWSSANRMRFSFHFLPALSRAAFPDRGT